MKKTNNKRALSVRELVWYLVAGFLFGAGVVLATLSLIGDYMNVPSADNWIITAQQAVINWSKISFDWLIWGTILMVIGLVISVITLLYFAKKVIAEKEKALRRAQRLGDEIVSNQ